ncbi:ABC transporter permease family protein [Salinibius halmophilus]|uniref:hypothetical protein n=1 Tax=Salinibius halmophilus TaxID=1853216 RepID=UPI000E667D3B|nr:hypothetical protein [Salinibius halmophilus]
MLPELSLSWRFLRPIRGLLFFLSILMAAFLALSQMYWHSYSAYQAAVPSGAAAKQYFTLGSDEIDAMGELDQCMIDQVRQLDGIDASQVYMGMRSHRAVELLHDSGSDAYEAYTFTMTEPSFVDFYGLQPVETFFDANQLFPERWVYVFDEWFQENQHLISEHQGYPALELYVEDEFGDQKVKGTLATPIAGVLPSDFNPWMDGQEVKFITSIGLASWQFVGINGVFELEPPSLAEDDLPTSWDKAARMQVIASKYDSASALQQSVNQQIFNQPAPCVSQQRDISNIKVLPGARTQTSTYAMLSESFNLLSIVTLAMGAIVLLFSLAIAQRLPLVRQSEMLIKVAMGAPPKRLTKQLLIEASLFLLFTLVVAGLIYWPLNTYALLLGFVKGNQVNLLVAALALLFVGLLLMFILLANRKLQQAHLVYQGLNTIRHNIANKFFALQLTHVVYSALIGVVMLIMLLLSLAYRAQLTPNDLLSKTDFLVVHSEYEDYDANGFSFGWNASLSNLLRTYPDDVAAACVGWETSTQNWQLSGDSSAIVSLYSGQATLSFFTQVLGVEQATARGVFLSQPAASLLGLANDTRDFEEVRLASVPDTAADGSLRLRGNTRVQGIVEAFNLPKRYQVPYVLSVSRGPECYGTMFVSPEFDIDQLNEITYDYWEPPKRYFTKTWSEYMAESQPLAQARLNLVMGLSLLAGVSLLLTLALNTRYLVNRMQPWYWLNIAQGQPPAKARQQIIVRVGMLSALALIVGGAIAGSVFYQLFPEVAKWLTLEAGLKTVLATVAGIFAVQLLVLWWCLRPIMQKDLSAWQN